MVLEMLSMCRTPHSKSRSDDMAFDDWGQIAAAQASDMSLVDTWAYDAFLSFHPSFPRSPWLPLAGC